MTATKFFRDFFPSVYHRDSQKTKRRKTLSSPCNIGMDIDGSDRQQHLQNVSNSLSTSPSLCISRSLASYGLPDRLDPFSIDYLMDFDYHDCTRNCDIPAHILAAIQNGDVNQLIQHYKSKDRLTVQHNSQGQTLLHLACRWGSVAIIKSILSDFKASVFVLDKQGRTPLHSLCIGMRNSYLMGSSNSRTCNHLESLRLLLQEKATLLLFKDKDGKVPLDYFQQEYGATNENVSLWKLVNELLHSERVVERVVEAMSHQMEISLSSRKMTAWEKIDKMMDLSGIDAAIIETGLSI